MEPLKVRLKGHPSTSSSATPDPTTNSSGSPQALGPGPSAPTEAPSTSKSYTPPVLPPNLALEPNMYEDAYYVPKEYRSMSYKDMSKEDVRAMEYSWSLEMAPEIPSPPLATEDIRALIRRCSENIDDFPPHDMLLGELLWLEGVSVQLRSIGISLNEKEVLALKEQSNKQEENLKLRDLPIVDQALLDFWEPRFSPLRPLTAEEHLENMIRQYKESSKDSYSSYRGFQKLWTTMVDKFEDSSDSVAFQKSVAEVVRMGWKLRDQQSAEVLNEFKELHYTSGSKNGQQ